MKQRCLLLVLILGSCVLNVAQLQALVPPPSYQATALPFQNMQPVQGIMPGASFMPPQTMLAENTNAPQESDAVLNNDPSFSQQMIIPQPTDESSQPEVLPDQTLPESLPASPDTIELPDKEIGIQGNWMKKKEWLKRSYDIYNQIQQLGVEIQTSRSTFNQRFNVLDEELDQFYKNYGVQQGKLDELFSSVATYLEKKKQRELAALAAEQRDNKILERDYKTKTDEVETLMRNYRIQLEQLKFSMKSIEDLDRSISDRLTKVDQQIESSSQLINQGAALLKTMWLIIDDTIARAKYYELVNTIQAPIQAIHMYLTVDLLNDFDRVSATIRQQIAKVLDDTRHLEAEGFVIKNRAPRLDEIRVQAKLEKEKAEREAQEAEKKRQEELLLKKRQAKTTPLPWWKKLATFVSSFFSYLMSLIW